MRLNKDLAQNISDKVMEILPYNINIMNEKGVIIGSGDKTRIDTIHEGAIEAISNKTMNEVYSTYGGAKPGVNTPIFWRDNVIGVIGGGGIVGTVDLMIEGSMGMMPAILRILTAGILAGVLIESGAAVQIAETIVKKLGKDRSLVALIIATYVLTNVPLTSLMMAGIIPSILGIIVTVFISKKLIQKGSKVSDEELSQGNTKMPSFFSAIIGPI